MHGRMRSVCCVFVFASVFCLVGGCYSPKVPQADKDEDPFAGADVNKTEVPTNEAPPPQNSVLPDLDYIKDMLRRSAEHAARCNTRENPGPRGIATVTVTYRNNGRLESVDVAKPHFGTMIGDCVQRAFEGVIVTSWTDKRTVTLDRIVDFDKKVQSPTP